MEPNTSTAVLGARVPLDQKKQVEDYGAGDKSVGLRRLLNHPQVQAILTGRKVD